MSQLPQSGQIYFIINVQLKLAWDLSHRQRNLVVGTPLKEEETQKVQSTAIDDPPLSLFIV